MSGNNALGVRDPTSSDPFSAGEPSDEKRGLFFVSQASSSSADSRPAVAAKSVSDTANRQAISSFFTRTDEKKTHATDVCHQEYEPQQHQQHQQYRKHQYQYQHQHQQKQPPPRQPQSSAPVGPGSGRGSFPTNLRSPGSGQGGGWGLEVSRNDEDPEISERGETGRSTFGAASDDERKFSGPGKIVKVGSDPAKIQPVTVLPTNDDQQPGLHERGNSGEGGTGAGSGDRVRRPSPDLGKEREKVADGDPPERWLLEVSHDDEGQSGFHDGDGEGSVGDLDNGQFGQEARGKVHGGRMETLREQLEAPATPRVEGIIPDAAAAAAAAAEDQLRFDKGEVVELDPLDVGAGHEASGNRKGSGWGQVGSGSSLFSVPSERKPSAAPEGALFGAIRGGRPEEVRAFFESDIAQGSAVRELTNPKLVALAAKGGSCQLLVCLLEAMVERLTMSQVAEVLAEAFHITSAGAGPASASDGTLTTLSMLLQHGAKPRSKDLILLCDIVDAELLEDCFFEAVASARNSFVPFLNLSIAFEGAMKVAWERERRVLGHLQEGLDNVLTETLKSLPGSVRCLTGGMATCTALLEPEGIEGGGGPGPLAVALACSHRIVTFATTPLCMNYMFLKFTRGLPALGDGPRVVTLQSPRFDPREESKGHESLTAQCQGSTLRGVLRAVGKALSGDEDGLFSLTVFPGMHFIVTGVTSLPNSYYLVPLMRMVLDAGVYVAVLVLFTKFVLLHPDGPLSNAEIAFACYIVTAFASETKELWRSTGGYLVDRWKIPQMLALQLSLVAFALRVIDPENPWGRGFYAVSSPLMYWRLLYYAQVLPSQGTTIQVLYGMATELGQFMVVMAVVMLGFALSFFAMFKDAKDQTFRDSLLDVFQAMLGEVGLFDDFVGSRFDVAATLLLVLYLVIMSIMLLNLLIAVMSTAHGRVEELVLIRVARARVYMYYRWAVQHDALPAPLNVVQLVVLLPCQVVDALFKVDSYPVARSAVGRVMFWLIMGPCAIVIGSLLWLLSFPMALVVIWGKSSVSVASRLRRTILCVLWVTVGAPLSLGVSWVVQATRVLVGRRWQMEASHAPRPVEDSIETMLREASGVGMADLRAQLRDPIVNKGVKGFAKELGQAQATVSHLQCLLEHMETTTEERIEALERRLEKKIEGQFELILAALSADRNSTVARRG